LAIAPVIPRWLDGLPPDFIQEYVNAEIVSAAKIPVFIVGFIFLALLRFGLFSVLL
jgi:hypothetical protein